MYDEAVVEGSREMSNGGPSSESLVLGLLVLIVALLGGGTLLASLSYSPPAPSQREAAPARTGKVEVNLGTRPYAFGSQGQARELLALMDQQPGKAEYSIAYDTGADVVSFGCNLNTGFLGRVHLRRDGHGSKETWNGHVIERLRSAAGGGSLNDTPAGKSFVNREDF